MKVIEKESERVLGTLSSIDKIENVSIRHRYEPFVFKYNFIVFQNDEGEFGVASPKNHIIREVNLV